MSKMKFILLATLSTLVMAPAAQAVVVVGGDNGWEVSFDGNVNGLYVYEDRDNAPIDLIKQTDVGNTAFERTLVTIRTGGAIGGAGDNTSRIRTGLLPAFFSFNVRSPEVNGLTGSARISFAPQIQNANTKNSSGPPNTQAGAQIDLREVFFNVDGGFGTLSIGRTLSLFSRHNILTDMTLFGAGAQGGAADGGTTLGRIGYGYVYPQFNARISYKTLVANGFQLEIGVYDPSRIAGSGQSHNETSSPRWETEATYATDFDGGNVKFFLSGLWQDAERTLTADQQTERTRMDNPLAHKDDATATGVAGGIVLGFQGVELVASGYTGEALGTVLMLDADSVDALGAERDNQGYILQATYTFQGATKIGVSYGASEADETTADRADQGFTVNVDASSAGRTTADCTGATGGAVTCTNTVGIESLSSLTFGVYHDVTSWFKVVAEYTKVENQWHDGRDREADVYAVGGFFLW